ncbi:MAG: toxin-activating lysine-acyltransferase [Bradyrhizobium sp.]|nr:toxin-activating lysine-acyltransferase [Bradyrhizobium sp.]
MLGEAALKEALAGFGVAPNAAGGFSAAPGSHTAGAAPTPGEPPPKTVAQLLGEITWLMTQSPRHKSIPLGDLEWLIMPAILLKQFRMFYKGDNRSASRYGRWPTTSWRSGSTPATSG